MCYHQPNSRPNRMACGMGTFCGFLCIWFWNIRMVNLWARRSEKQFYQKTRNTIIYIIGFVFRKFEMKVFNLLALGRRRRQTLMGSQDKFDSNGQNYIFFDYTDSGLTERKRTNRESGQFPVFTIVIPFCCQVFFCKTMSDGFQYFLCHKIMKLNNINYHSNIQCIA